MNFAIMSDITSENITSLVPYMTRQYHFLINKNRDPRMMEWPLMGSTSLIVWSTLGYLLLSCYALPKLMVDRQPFQMKRVIMAYNAFQVALNIWIIILCVRGGWFNGYSFRCQPGDFSRNPKAMAMLDACWWYLFAKFVDWLDTAFFVLRKSYRQVSFLHMFHHMLMPFFVWYTIRFIGGGHWTLVILCNSFVHVVMYMYYLLAALGYQKYLWWKKYLTIMQMAQFIILAIHEYQLFFNECNYPRFTRILTIPLGPSLLMLFYNFYSQAYKGRRNSSVSIAKVQSHIKEFTCLQG